MNETIKETIGCDLGDRQSELCVLSGPVGSDETLFRPKPIRTTKAGFKAFFDGRAQAHVVLEVGTHSRWVSELLEQLGHQVTVANPRKLPMITASQKKTDRNDAEMLARLGRADLRLLSPVEHRGNATQADLAVAKTRKLLVESRTKQINSIRGMVKAFGERLQECDSEGFHRVTRSTLPPALKPALEPMYEVLGMLETQIKVLDKTLAKMAERYPDVKVISQINGVGLLTALVFLLTVEDKTRFKQSRDAGAFFGMVPRKDQSGDTDKQLGITKGGDAFVRSLLVNSANYIMGPFGAPSDLRTWGNKLAARGGKNARKRAKVAVARKLAVLMHRLWVTGEVYEPLRNSTKTERATA